MQWLSKGLSAFTVVSLSFTPLLAAPQNVAPEVKVENEEEAFLVRRIAEFWKDQDYPLVKRQIYEFLESYPLSNISDHLRGILGDLYIQEGDYRQALIVYKEITDYEAKQKIIVNKLQCYYELDQYSAILDEGSPILDSNAQEIASRRDELYFLVGEALFREALSSDDSSLKTNYANKARPLYENILETVFADHARFALAEIYSLIGEHESASKLFIEQASRHEDRKEELLYHAGVAQSEFDKPTAIDTFSEVIVLNGKHQNDAAVNRLILMFQEERFSDVINHYPEVVGIIDGEKKELFDYIVGRSYFAIDDFESSSTYLSKFINLQESATPHFKNALLMQLTSAQKIGQDELFDSTIARFREHYVDDEELQKALFIHAMILKNKGDTQLAEAELTEIMQRYPNYSDMENLLLEYGLVTHENQKWKESYLSLKNYLSLYPAGEQSHVAWKYYLSSSLNFLKSMDETNYEYTKREFFNDLSAVMQAHNERGNILNSDEERECRLLYAKTAYELENFEAALSVLEAYVVDYSSDSTVGEAYFLTGLCHHKFHADPHLFCSFAEKALQIDAELRENPQVHLQLYNAYLSQIESSRTDEVSQVYDQAAEHLYIVAQKQIEELKLENRMWLANHYYEKSKNNDEAQERALWLFGHALTSSDMGSMITLNERNVYLEAEALKYADLLGKTHRHSEKVALLKNLVSQQHSAQLSWKYQKQAILELAKTYELLNEKESALDTYSFLTKTYSHNPSYITDYAALHEARLGFELTDPRYRNGENESVIAILSRLKELQIKKAPETEPMHVEAAIDYARVRASIAEESDQPNRYLFFLGRLKEDYQSDSDPMVRLYHEKLATLEEKKAILDLHMEFVEAETLRMKAKKAYVANRVSEAEELASQAIGRLTQIRESCDVTPYLQERVRESLSEIDTMNAY
ncbi:MAG: hypothetical protein MRY21_01740 [Simkaniaceae bacterium]|nr:hypothetical protein [Simkaniaceae bacterium]